MDIIARIPASEYDYAQSYRVQNLDQPLEVYNSMDKMARRKLRDSNGAQVPVLPVPTANKESGVGKGRVYYRSPSDLNKTMEDFWVDEEQEKEYQDALRHEQALQKDEDIEFYGGYSSPFHENRLAYLRSVYAEHNPDTDELFTPAIKFSPFLCAEDELRDATELHHDLCVLEGIFKRCREGPQVGKGYRKMKNWFYIPEEIAFRTSLPHFPFSIR